MLNVTFPKFNQVLNYISLCVGGIKGKAGIQLKCILGKLCNMHIIGK